MYRAQFWTHAASYHVLRTSLICWRVMQYSCIFTPTYDTQFNNNCRPEDTDMLRNRLSCCTRDIISWCTSRCLQPNANKTEAIWVELKSNLAKLTTWDCSIQIGDSIIQPSTIIRDLGVRIDRELPMKQHIARVALSCYYRLHCLRQICRRVGGEVAPRPFLTDHVEN